MQVVVAGDITALALEVVNLFDESATFAHAAGQATDNALVLINRSAHGVF